MGAFSSIKVIEKLRFPNGDVGRWKMEEDAVAEAVR